MAVVIETTLGDITVDLFLEQRPVTCLNFLKLCKMKYYNFNLFHSIRSGFIAQTGDPTSEGSGGESIFGLLEGPEKRFFSGEKMPKIRHTDTGMLSMVGTGDMMVGSQFFFTLGSDLDSLDGNHCVIGEVTEGQEVLRKLNEVICDETHRPYQDVRITHTVVLEDPYSDPAGFRAPSRSPSPSAERLRGGRIAPDEELDDTQGKSAQEIQEIIEEKEAKARATILEMVGDLPDADIAPPENVLFVCKLNPVTTDEDLEIIFSRFGKIVSCEVIRDKKTGDSLQYAFIEFTDKKCCEEAYFKMDNVLIDDRRIHVDFSQSVSKIKWLGKGRGVRHLTDEEVKKENSFVNKNKSRRSRSNERDRADQTDRFNDHDRNRHRTDNMRNKEKDHETSRNKDERDRYSVHRKEYNIDKRDKKEYEKQRDRKREVRERHQDDRERNCESTREKNRDSKGQNGNDRETRKPDKRIDRKQDTYKNNLDEKRDSIENKNSNDRKKSNKESHNSDRRNESDEDYKEKKRNRNHHDRRQSKEPDGVYESKEDKYGKEKKREDRVKERKQREEKEPFHRERSRSRSRVDSKDKLKSNANYDTKSIKRNHSIEKNSDGRKSNHYNSDESHSKDIQSENITTGLTKSSKKLDDKDKPKSRHDDNKHEMGSGLKRSRVDKGGDHDSKSKRKEQKEDTTEVKKSKTKHDNKHEDIGLSIDKPEKREKNIKRKKENEKKMQNKTKSKKKRKDSTTSSDSESSSSSSSSSESSSSSDSDRKKKKARRRKRKASSSTSSSSSNSSTSSSSDSSSESSSSSSDSDVKSKKSKTSKKKMVSKKGRKK